jgi:hypothetical protein
LVLKSTIGNQHSFSGHRIVVNPNAPNIFPASRSEDDGPLLRSRRSSTAGYVSRISPLDNLKSSGLLK